MHPTRSVIVFTSATGAGYGLLALIGLLTALGLAPESRAFGAVGIGLALALVTGGLLSSLLHLGRPERAWRALSQWRSSWLSREGVMSLATYLPAGAFGLSWLLVGRPSGLVAALGVAAAAFALATVATTAMIYASLRPVARWHSPYTLPGYLLLSVMTGAILLHALTLTFSGDARPVGLVALAAIGAAWIWKLAAWRSHDTAEPVATFQSATGLAGGALRSVEWPHTEENYVLKEMGFRIARKHSARLRRIAVALCFAVPLVATALAFVSPAPLATVAAIAAVISAAPGVLVERWLFFAEATHTARIYYGV